MRWGNLILPITCVLCMLWTTSMPIQSDPPAEAFQVDGTLRRIRVPILMYHYVSPLPPDADAYRRDLTLSPRLFREHMQYLYDNGYTTISFYELHAALVAGTPLPDQPVILSFDDGYTDHYQHVYPILLDFGFTGTFFVITGKADAGASGYLNWTEVREMADAGMHMESHTRNHFDLRGRDYDFLVFEIVGSIESLNAHTGRDIRIFSYPAGRYDQDTLRVLASTPILRAVTTAHGTWHTTDNYLELPRLRVSSHTGVIGLAHLLSTND